MDDLEFVQSLCGGDKHPWEKFVERYSRLIYSCIYHILRLKGLSGLSRESIDDLFQEIILFLAKDNYKKLKSFRAKNGCRLSSWLYQVVINYSLDYLRRQRQGIVSLDEENRQGDPIKDLLSDDGLSAKDRLLDKEKLEDLAECINRLDKSDQYFLELYLNQGLSLRELKITLRLSRGAVDMRKFRILARLKDCFASKGYALG